MSLTLLLVAPVALVAPGWPGQRLRCPGCAAARGNGDPFGQAEDQWPSKRGFAASRRCATQTTSCPGRPTPLTLLRERKFTTNTTPKAFNNVAQGKRSATLGLGHPCTSTPKGFHTVPRRARKGVEPLRGTADLLSSPRVRRFATTLGFGVERLRRKQKRTPTRQEIVHENGTPSPKGLTA